MLFVWGTFGVLHPDYPSPPTEEEIYLQMVKARRHPSAGSLGKRTLDSVAFSYRRVLMQKMKAAQRKKLYDTVRTSNTPVQLGSRSGGHFTKSIVRQRRVFSPLLVAHPLLQGRQINSVSVSNGGVVTISTHDTGECFSFEAGEIGLHHGDPFSPAQDTLSSPDLLATPAGHPPISEPSILPPPLPVPANAVLVPCLTQNWTSRGGAVRTNVRRLESFPVTCPLVSVTVGYRRPFPSKTSVKEAVTGKAQHREWLPNRDDLIKWRQQVIENKRAPILLAGRSAADPGAKEPLISLSRLRTLPVAMIDPPTWTPGGTVPNPPGFESNSKVSEVQNLQMAIGAVASANRRERLGFTDVLLHGGAADGSRRSHGGSGEAGRGTPEGDVVEKDLPLNSAVELEEDFE